MREVLRASFLGLVGTAVDPEPGTPLKCPGWDILLVKCPDWDISLIKYLKIETWKYIVKCPD